MKLAILSANPSLYSTNRLKEAAERRGHDVEVINHNHCYVAMETDANSVYLGDHELEGNFVFVLFCSINFDQICI